MKQLHSSKKKYLTKNRVLFLVFYILFIFLFNVGYAQDFSEKNNFEMLVEKSSNDSAKNISNKINKKYLIHLGNDIIDLFFEKNCQQYITKTSGYFLLSFGCSIGYSNQDRTEFLDYIYSNGFYLKNEEYDLEKKRGIYLYKFQQGTSKNDDRLVFIKFFFRDIEYLYPKRPSIYDKLALMVTDVSSVRQIYQWQELGIPLSYGILPFREETKEISLKVKKYQQEPWLAISLEPKKYSSKMTNIVLIEDVFKDKKKVSLFIKKTIEEVNPIGVYNRFGSKFTENVYATRYFLKNLKKNQILNFLDIVSTPKSVAYKTSQILSMNSYKRDFILDPHLSLKNKEVLWDKILILTKKKGAPIVLVHAEDSQTFNFLKQYIKKNNTNISFVFISNIPVDLQ